MSTHKHFDRICVVVVILSLLLTSVFMCGSSLGIQSSGQTKTLGYETRLFDTGQVHTIDIVMDDWEGFLDSCENEEYTLCALVIDGESCKNVAIRAKGNTSLSSVSSMNSQRYSFKLEFDHYDSGKSYYGLDKLSLNNLIQDNTMMKDYLCYQLMQAFGVNSSLCSFAYITVNGEDWGLYLAVEGVEDAFLRRNYGSDSGELYKPDSLSFGGGRGNGRKFDMEEFAAQVQEDRDTDTVTEEQTAPQAGDSAGFAPTQRGGASGFDPTQMGDASDFDPTQMGGASGFDPAQMGDFSDFIGFGSGMGAEDTKLQYIDDDPDSYSNIFDNAKTDITASDQARLIQSLKSLSAFTDLDEVLDIDQVLRYFVVHSFVVNDDSYTGSMVHNYYLYEQDGQLAMIPWDYNLAFGGFQSGSASAAVNDPIDQVLDDRPMQAWIFSDERYTAQYHALYREFLDSVDIQGLIADAYALIAPYVAQDPTKFCTDGEFEAGTEALREFCALRSESVRGQLDGTVGSTTAVQNADSGSLVDAGDLMLSDMGSMNSGGMGGQVMPSGEFSQVPAGDSAESEGGDIRMTPEMSSGSRQDSLPEDMTPPDGTDARGGFSPGGQTGGMTPPDSSGDTGASAEGGTRSAPADMSAPESAASAESVGSGAPRLLLISAGVLFVGLLLAFVLYRKK